MNLLNPALTRVMIEHTPRHFALFGMVPVEDCHPVIGLPDAEGDRHTYYRVRSTPRWVFYRPAIVGAPDQSFHKEQR